MRRFRKLYQQHEQADACANDPTTERRTFSVTQDRQDEAEREKLNQHLGHEGLTVENAQRCEDKEKVRPKNFGAAQHPPPNELQTKKCSRPKQDARYLSAKIEIVQQRVSAEHEIIVERKFQHIMRVEVAQPRNFRAEIKPRLLHQTFRRRGGLALPEQVRVEQRLRECDTANREANR